MLFNLITKKVPFQKWLRDIIHFPWVMVQQGPQLPHTSFNIYLSNPTYSLNGVVLCSIVRRMGGASSFYSAFPRDRIGEMRVRADHWVLLALIRICDFILHLSHPLTGAWLISCLKVLHVGCIPRIISELTIRFILQLNPYERAA